MSTDLICNVDFSRHVDVYKTAIMSHLLSVDQRIYDLAFIIKFWLKQQHIFSSNDMNSYAALWLMFFYLQSEEEPVLPPIFEYQKKMPPFEVNGINVAFNYHFRYETKNKRPLSYLLFRFFAFYRGFDFESQVICPAIGRAMARTEYQKTFSDTKNIQQKICIQDPFEKACLMPEQISPESFEKFRNAVQKAAQMCRSKLNNGPIGRDCLFVLFSGDEDEDASYENQLAVDPTVSSNAMNDVSGPEANPRPVASAQKRPATDDTSPIPLRRIKTTFENIAINEVADVIANNIIIEDKNDAVVYIKREPSLHINEHIARLGRNGPNINIIDVENIASPTPSPVRNVQLNINATRSNEPRKCRGRSQYGKSMGDRSNMDSKPTVNNEISAVNQHQNQGQVAKVNQPLTRNRTAAISLKREQTNNTVDMKPTPSNEIVDLAPVNQPLRRSRPAGRRLKTENVTGMNIKTSLSYEEAANETANSSNPSFPVNADVRHRKLIASVKRIEVFPKKEDLTAMKSYMEKVLNMDGDANNGLLKKEWARFSVHFLIGILQQICRAKRLYNNGQSNVTPFSQKLLIDGLYDKTYHLKQTVCLAAKRNVQLEVIDISPVDIMCHVHVNDTHDMIHLDIHDNGAKNIDLFCGELIDCIPAILSENFERILNYVLFEPRAELLEYSNEDLDLLDDGLKTVPAMTATLRHGVSVNQLANLEQFLNKWEMPVKLEQKSVELHKIWARCCIDFVLDIMTKTFALKLDQNDWPVQFADSDYSKSFDVSGIYDVFYRRAQNNAGTNHAGFLFKEKKKTLNALSEEGERLDNPLRAIFHVRADTENYGTVHIDIYNLRAIRRGDPMANFVKQFKSRLTKLIVAYFEKMLDDCLVFNEESQMMPPGEIGVNILGAKIEVDI